VRGSLDVQHSEIDLKDGGATASMYQLRYGSPGNISKAPTAACGDWMPDIAVRGLGQRERANLTVGDAKD
jgi:hypothetical protein